MRDERNLSSIPFGAEGEKERGSGRRSRRGRLRGHGPREWNSRQGTEGDSGEDDQLSVRYEAHGGVVVPLDPELDLVADILEGCWRRSSLAGRSGCLGAAASARLDTAFPTGFYIPDARLTGQTWG